MTGLRRRLPEVAGRLIESAPLASASRFRVGGAAEILFLPRDEADLARFLEHTPSDIPVCVLGAASNVLIRDGGIAGVVIRLLGSGWNSMSLSGPLELKIGAGTFNIRSANFAARHGLGGLEFLSGIPGMAGGALAMNAGCHGRETSDVLVSATAISRQGERLELSPAQLDFSYRHAAIPAGAVISSLRLRAMERAEPEQILARIAELNAKREASQPITERTGGSTFTNPASPKGADQRKAWQLLDAAGMRGVRHGGAQISPKHCNFLINTGAATAMELESLAMQAHAAVKAQSGIDLCWEIRRFGQYQPYGQAMVSSRET